MQTSHKLIGLLTAAALTAVLGLVLSEVVISLAATSGEEFMQLCEVAPRTLNDLVPFLFASSVLVVFGALLFGAGRTVKTGMATVAAIGVGLLVFVAPPQTANAAPSCLYVDGSNAMTANLNMGGFNLTNLDDIAINATDTLSIDGGSVIVNDASGDYDLTVETDNNTQTLVVDGGADQVRMGGNLIADTGRLLIYQKPSIAADNSPSTSWWTSGTTTIPEAAAYTETYGAYFGQTTWAGVAGGAAETLGTASTVYIAGPAVQGANITLTDPYALKIASGNVSLGLASQIKYGTTGHLITNEGTNGLVIRAQAAATESLLLWRPTSHATPVTTVGSPIVKGAMRDSDNGTNYSALGWGIDYGGVSDVEGDSWIAATWAGSGTHRDLILNVSDTDGNPNLYGIRIKGADTTVTRTRGLLLVDGRNTVDNIKSVVVQVANTNLTQPIVAGVAGSTYSAFGVDAFTWTTSTTTTITNMRGLAGHFGIPTIAQSGGAVTVSRASTVYIAGPAAGASVTITAGANFALELGGALLIPNNVRLAFANVDGTIQSTFLYHDTSNQLRVTTGGTDRWVYQASGHYAPLGNNTYDIGLGTLMPRTLYLGTSLVLGANSTNNTFSTGILGAASTTMYIGNASINVTSDARVKYNIAPFTGDALALLGKLAVVEYDQDLHRPLGNIQHYTNLLAQNVYEVAPWAVNTQGDTGLPWQVNYGLMTGLQVSAIQQLDSRTNDMQSQIDMLKAEFAVLRANRQN